MSEQGILFLQGNEAAAMGAIAAKANFYAGYPITPATEIAEMASVLLPQNGGKFVQMEDEIACLGAVIGASAVGARAFTATSGPGFSLMQENLGYASFAEIPCVIMLVQRGGPSTGVPTQAAQSDIMQIRWGTHGDHPIIALSPSTVEEMYTLAIKCFNFAEKYRVPVVLAADAIIGHMRERVRIPAPDEIELITRKKPSTPPEEYLPYRPDADQVPPMANLGENGYRYYISGTMHNEAGLPCLSNPQMTRDLIERLHKKIETSEVLLCDEDWAENDQTLVIAYGCTARSARQAVAQARKMGIKVGMFRPITLWPVPEKRIIAAAKNKKRVIVAEMNRGQYVGEVSRILAQEGISAKTLSVSETGCVMIRPQQILNAILGGASNHE